MEPSLQHAGIVSGEGKSQTTTEYAGQLRESFSFLKIVYTGRKHFLGSILLLSWLYILLGKKTHIILQFYREYEDNNQYIRITLFCKPEMTETSLVLNLFFSFESCIGRQEQFYFYSKQINKWIKQKALSVLMILSV